MLYTPETFGRGHAIMGADARDYGQITMTCDPGPIANSAGALTTGLQYVMKVWMPTTSLVTNVTFSVVTIGATLTAGANNLALYDSTGTRIAATVDQTTNYTTTGNKTVAFSSPVTCAGGPGVFYWIGMKSTGTTPVSVNRESTGAATLSNYGLAASVSRAASAGTVTNALMPASFTPSTLTQVPNVILLGLT